MVLVERFDINSSAPLPIESYTSKEVGSFAINDSGDFAKFNNATFPQLKKMDLRRFSPPFDLNAGYENWDPNEETTNFPQWEKILKWVKEMGYSSIKDVKIITQRGILKDIGYTPFNFFKNPWTFEVGKYSGKVYMRKTEAREDLSDEWHKKNSYWGTKFEDYLATPTPHIKSAYKVYVAKIEGKKALFGAEIDAVNGKEIIEMKTCFEDKVRRKLPAAWLQSHLAGIDTLLYGFKDRNGYVRSARKYSVAQLPGREMSKGDSGSMLGLISAVVEWLLDTLPDDDSTWDLRYSGGSTLELVKQGTSRFLPNWYRQYVDEEELTRNVGALAINNA